MKKYRISEQVDCLSGYLRYGHLETTIEAATKKEALDIYKKQMEEDECNYDDLVVDDYSVNDWERDSNPEISVCEV